MTESATEKPAPRPALEAPSAPEEAPPSALPDEVAEAPALATIPDAAPLPLVPEPRSPSPRTWVPLAAASFLGTVLGAALGGAMLGVVQAGELSPPMAAPAVAAPPDAGGASTTAEVNPETAGDGVMDDLEEPELPPAPTSAPVPSPAMAAASLTAPSSRSLVAAAPAVVPASAPRAPGGARVVNSDGVPEGPAQGYVDGRAVRIVVTRLDDKPVEVRTAAAYRRMRDAAERDRVHLRIVSGFRTMEHQQALYRAYRRGRGNLAALPGHSNHQSGHALDLNTSAPGVLRWLERHARRYGFRRTVPTEPWHWEWW